MARSESDDRLTDTPGPDSERYDFELVEPVAVGGDAGETVDTEARLTLPGPNGERIQVVGDPDDLRRRLDQILAFERGETADERRERVEEYPMPDLDDLETVPADEFHSDADGE